MVRAVKIIPRTKLNLDVQVQFGFNEYRLFSEEKNSAKKTQRSFLFTEQDVEMHLSDIKTHGRIPAQLSIPNCL